MSTSGIGTLGIDAHIFIAQLINFVIVLLVMWRFAYRPIVRLLDERSKKIATSLKQVEEIETRLNQTAEENKKALQEARTEAVRILEQAQSQAELAKQQMLTNAKFEVERVVLKGKQQLEAEQQHMIERAREELVHLAVSSAQNILKHGIDEKTSLKLAKETIDELIAL